MSRGFITVLESMLFNVMNVAWLLVEFTLPDTEQRVVRRVQRFDPHLHADAIAEPEILRQSEIQQVVVHEPHIRQCRRERADVRLAEHNLVGGLEGDRLSGRVPEWLVLQRVEARQVDDRRIDAAEHALPSLPHCAFSCFGSPHAGIEIGVGVEHERLADLPFELRAELPSAENRVDDGRPVAPPPAFAANRQLGHRRERDAMRPIDCRDALFRLFPRVQRRHLLAHPRPGIRAHQHEPCVNRLSARKIIP